MRRSTPIVPKDSQQTNIRLPEGMRERLKREAAAHGRTLNTEIVLRLERSLDESDESSANALREYLQDELAAMRAEMVKMRELMAAKK
jgi:predicted DNA-binding protein